MPRKRRQNNVDGRPVFKDEAAALAAERPLSNGVVAEVIGLNAEQISTREKPTWRVWLVVAATVVGLVFPWWYGVVSFVVDVGRVAGWW